MRILMISWEYPPYVVGGMGKHVAELVPVFAQAVPQRSFTLDVITTRCGGVQSVESLSDSVTIYRVDVPPIDPVNLYNSIITHGGLLTAQARKLALNHQYDLIHNHDWLTNTASVVLKHEWKVPLISTIHSTERGRHQGYLTNDISHQINHVEWQECFEAWRLITCSHYMAGELQYYFGTPLDKISVVPNGVDMQMLHRCPPQKRAKLRQQYSPNGEKLILYVGRITHEKGLQVLIQAMPKIIEQFPGVRLLAAGKNGEHLQPFAQKLGVSNEVHFLGYIPDEERDYLYQIVDTAIFPSLYEPFGIVAIEAMALGCHVIASDIHGLSEVMDHPNNGLTIYPNDPDSIVWAVRQFKVNYVSINCTTDYGYQTEDE